MQCLIYNSEYTEAGRFSAMLMVHNMRSTVKMKIPEQLIHLLSSQRKAKLEVRRAFKPKWSITDAICHTDIQIGNNMRITDDDYSVFSSIL